MNSITSALMSSLNELASIKVMALERRAIKFSQRIMYCHGKNNVANPTQELTIYILLDIYCSLCFSKQG